MKLSRHGQETIINYIQKLKTLLKDNGMTQEDLAERLEVSRQAVGKWVNDKGIPEAGKIVQISNLFGVSTDYLLKENCEEKGGVGGCRQREKTDFRRPRWKSVLSISGNK